MSINTGTLAKKSPYYIQIEEQTFFIKRGNTLYATFDVKIIIKYN